MISAHADTIGMVVRRVDSDGKLRVRALGGVNFSNMEGSSVTVHTRDGRCYTGLLACQAHSTHVFKDCNTMQRMDENMIVILDENVTTKEEVNALGIRNGDLVAADPQCEVTENGYLKSRYIDDKAGVACCFAMLKYLAEKADCKYAVDVFYIFSTDANAAVYAGNNLRAAAFGMAVYCSHGRERTHISGLENTMNLLLAYVLDI